MFKTNEKFLRKPRNVIICVVEYPLGIIGHSAFRESEKNILVRILKKRQYVDFFKIRNDLALKN